MINENQLSEILLINNYKIQNNNTLFGSPLKKFINNIYNKFEIPKESFIISLFYLYQYYNINKNNFDLIEHFFNNIHTYIFTCIIISLKQLFDENINLSNICDLSNVDYNSFIETELIILKGLNWKTSFNNNNYESFKKLLEHYIY